MQRSGKGLATSGEASRSEQKAIDSAAARLGAAIRHRKKSLRIKILRKNHVTFLYTSKAQA